MLYLCPQRYGNVPFPHPVRAKHGVAHRGRNYKEKKDFKACTTNRLKTIFYG